MFTAEYFIKNLNLQEHIEGGYFTELHKNPITINDNSLPIKFDGHRNISSTIYYLMESGQVSKFHKLNFDEVWFYHYGSPCIIHMIDPDGSLISKKLGLNLAAGETPQVLVPANVVFGTEVIDSDSFSLVSCVVSPGFDYRDFEIYKSTDLIKRFPKHTDLIKKLNG